MPMLHPFVLLPLYVLACLMVAVAGRHHRWGFWGHLWAAVLFTPVVGALFVLATDRPQRSTKGAHPRGDGRP